MVRKRIDAAVIIVGPLTYLLRQQIGDATIKHHLPALATLSEYAHAGVLMSYGPNLLDLYRRAGSYVDKILRGTRLADLPVEQPSKFALTINLKTAKALGLKMAQSLLVQAEDVIQ